MDAGPPEEVEVAGEDAAEGDMDDEDVEGDAGVPVALGLWIAVGVDCEQPVSASPAPMANATNPYRRVLRFVRVAVETMTPPNPEIVPVATPGRCSPKTWPAARPAPVPAPPPDGPCAKIKDPAHIFPTDSAIAVPQHIGAALLRCRAIPARR